MTTGGIRATLPLTAPLARDEVRNIGIAAIRRATGDPALRIEFKLDVDPDDRSQYSFRLYFPTVEAWRAASTRMLEITDAVMADLSMRNDDHFPFIWLLSDGSWAFERNAAAE